jgi:hypothetical protein
MLVSKVGAYSSRDPEGKLLTREYYRGKDHCTADLLFDWLGISCMTTDSFCFYLQIMVQ